MTRDANADSPTGSNAFPEGPAMKLAWLMLALAIASEVTATTALKLSEGFTKWGPSVVVVLGYGCAFYLMAQVLKSLEVGIVYAVWSGAGLAIIALIGVLWFGETISFTKLAGLLAILIGIILLNVTGSGHG